MEKYISIILLALLIVAPLSAIHKERIVTQIDDSSVVIKDYRGCYNGYINIENSTGRELFYLYLTHEDDTLWGADLLGDYTIDSGGAVKADLQGFQSSFVDIYAQDYDDNQYVFYGIDVAYQDLNITIEDMKGRVESIGDTLINAQAGIFDGYVNIINETGYNIFYLQYRHSDIDTAWSSDLLGTKTLYNDNAFTLNLSDFPTSLFDFRAEDEDGDLYTIEAIDIEYDDLTITLNNLDGESGYTDTTIHVGSGDLKTDFTLINRTGNNFFELYVMPSSENEWKDNLLAEYSLSSKDSINIKFDNFSSPLFDILSVDEDGNSYIFRNVDIVHSDVEIYLNDIGEQGVGGNVGDTIITGMSPGFDGSVEISNQTGYPLYSLQVVLDDSLEWGGNILSVDKLDIDESFTAVFINHPSNIIKVRAIDINGDNYTVRTYPASRDTLVLSLSNAERHGITIGSAILSEDSGDFEGYVAVTNNTNTIFKTLQLSPSGESIHNSRNLLGETVIKPGQAFTIELEKFPTSLVDISVQSVDRKRFTIREIDVEFENIIISDEDYGDHIRDHSIGTVELTDSSGTFDGDIKVVNRTGYTIHNLQLTENGKKGWGANLLDQSPKIRSGKSFTVELSGFSSSIFNIRITDEDDDSYTYMKYDIENGELVFTIDDLD